MQSHEQIKQYIDRIERLAEEKQSLADDMKDVYAEAKGNGFDVPALREVIRLRKKSAQEREELEELVDLYKNAVGM